MADERGKIRVGVMRNCSSSGARSIIPSSSSSSQILVPFFSDLRERERIKSF
ncbi:hypothetical protein HN51_036987, partial [Arachis hypogaea]